MRFPWLQVDLDFLEAKAGDLGALLDISRREAVGLSLDLWAWCLKRAPDDRPPDGVVLNSRSGTGAGPVLERAASWTGPEGLLVAALEDCGMLERVEGGLRLRGLGRYATTWKKNKRRPGSAPVPEANSDEAAPKPERKTQTQMETQKKQPLAGSDSRPPVSDTSADEVPQADPADVTEEASLPEACTLEGAHKPATNPPKIQESCPAGPRPEELQALWNELAPPKGLQRWERMSDNRKRVAVLHLAAVPDLARWRAWLTAELARPFNRGQNDTGWRADVEWLLRAKTRDLVADFDPTLRPRGTAPRGVYAPADWSREQGGFSLLSDENVSILDKEAADAF